MLSFFLVVVVVATFVVRNDFAGENMRVHVSFTIFHFVYGRSSQQTCHILRLQSVVTE